MNKIMIALGAIALAAVSQAATVNWSAGKVYAPAADGSIATWNGTKWTFGTTAGDSYAVKMYVWESLTQQTFSDGDLFKKYQDNQLTGAIAGTYDSSKSTATATGVLAPANAGDNVYANVLFVLEDAKGNAQWYMENTVAKATGSQVQTQNSLAMYENGNSKNNPMTWSSVPEPTSGLLLLLGMAGLALRRRRA